MSEANEQAKVAESPAQAGPPKPSIHRVCIQCNNMFLVPFDRYDAKQCPNCHKG